jgi:predicted MFS family arabinose efflux permease
MLSLYQLFIVTLVMSVTTVFFSVAYTAYLPTLIAREDLVDGNSKLETSSSAAAVVGPPIAGGLIQIVGAASSIALDALGTLVAAIAIISIKKPEPPPAIPTQPRFWSEIEDGVRVVTETPTLRNLAVSTSILNIGNGMFFAVFYLFIYDQLKMSPVLAGITVGIGGVGVVVGAVTAPKLLKSMGLGTALTAALMINGLGLLAVRASMYGPAIAILAPIWLIANIGIPIYNINQVSFRQILVPDTLQGRMNATMRTFSYGAVTLGALIGGIIGAQYGILTTMTAGGLIAILAALMIRFGPVGRLHDMPQNVEMTQSRLDALNPPEKKAERSEVAEREVSMKSPEKGVGGVGGGGFLNRLKTRLQRPASSSMGTSARRGIPTKPQGYASCRRCGLPIVRATRFCQSCGADFGRVVCSCGRELGSGNRFCDRCGRKV